MISISPADCLSPATVLSGRERERAGRNCVGSSLGSGAGKGNFLLGLRGESEGDERKGWGWCKKGLCLGYRAGLAGPSPAPGGRPHQHRRRGARKEGGAASRPGAELEMSFRGRGSSRQRPHPASLPGKRRLNGRWAENGRRTRRGTRPRPSARPPAAGLPASR